MVSLMGPRTWGLPRWLDRITPSADVEGESQSQGLAAAPESRTLESV